MELENNNSRRSFFKKMLLSAGAVVLAKEVFSENHTGKAEQPKQNVSMLSEKEIKENLKNVHSSGSKKYKPEPAPEKKADNI